jgi:hypothetical protein
MAIDIILMGLLAQSGHGCGEVRGYLKLGEQRTVGRL